MLKESRPLQVEARAKVNLFLHVIGMSSDGCHLLESLFAKLKLHDIIRVEPALGLRCKLLKDGKCVDLKQKNIALKAAQALQEYGKCTAGADIYIEKNIPIGAGLGGGSADAAAVLHLLSHLWKMKIEDHALKEIALKVGADIPFLLSYHEVALVGGIGEELTPVSLQEKLHLLLVNPGFECPTAVVYQRGGQQYTRGLADRSPKELVRLIYEGKNDLEAPAKSICPHISVVLGNIAAQRGCIVARLSGSGATCFGLFKDESSAIQAQTYIKRHHPSWWSWYEFLEV